MRCFTSKTNKLYRAFWFCFNLRVHANINQTYLNMSPLSSYKPWKSQSWRGHFTAVVGSSEVFKGPLALLVSSLCKGAVEFGKVLSHFC